MNDHWTQRQPHEVKCDHCGKKFRVGKWSRVHGKRSKRYHSNKCATAARVARLRAKRLLAEIERKRVDIGLPVLARYATCDFCGLEFLTVTPPTHERMYCQPPRTCRENAEQLRRKLKD